MLEGNGVVREEGEYVFTRKGFCAFGYFDVVGEDGRAGEDGFVDMEFGTVLAAFGTQLNDEYGGREIAAIGEGCVRYVQTEGRMR